MQVYELPSFSKINLTGARRNNKVALITLEKLHYDILELVNWGETEVVCLQSFKNPRHIEDSERHSCLHRRI